MTDILVSNNVQTLVFETATGGNTRAKNFRIFGFAGRLLPCVKERVSQSALTAENSKEQTI